MRKINCYLSNEIKNYYLRENKHYHMIDIKQFFNYFLPKNIDITLNDDFNNSDIFFWNMELNNNSILDKNKINILISIENINYWGKEMKKNDWPGYIHFSKYNDFNDEKINIYYYNHINKIIENENFIAIPMIYVYINYYLNNHNLIKPLNNISFNNKKFCLVINKSGLHKDIDNYINLLKNIDDIDNIFMYKEIENKSCYHSVELITIFNKYKFILCIENSIGEGYITEKIFNCFFAKSIPIFIGTNDINLFINKKSFIDGIENNLSLIKEINSNENLYKEYIYSDKIVDNYNNENYIGKLNEKISEKNK
jgi:hypothetical protein